MNMLDKIFESKTAQIIFLHLFHYGETYPSAVAKDFQISLGQVQRQFDRFEEAGIFISKLSGKTRIYQFNKTQGAMVKPFMELVKVFYDSIPVKEKEEIFNTRRRPRRKGKPVITKK